MLSKGAPQGMTYHVRIDYSSVYELIGSFMLFVHRKWIRNVENGMEWARSIEQQLLRSGMRTARRSGSIR